MDKDKFQCGKKSLNYQTNVSYLQIIEKEDERTHLGVGLPPTELSPPTPSYHVIPPYPTIPTLPNYLTLFLSLL